MIVNVLMSLVVVGLSRRELIVARSYLHTYAIGMCFIKTCAFLRYFDRFGEVFELLTALREKLFSYIAVFAIWAITSCLWFDQGAANGSELHVTLWAANLSLISIYSIIVITVVTFQSHKEVNDNSNFSSYKLKNEINMKYASSEQKYVSILLQSKADMKVEIEKYVQTRKEKEMKSEIDRLI